MSSTERGSEAPPVRTPPCASSGAKRARIRPAVSPPNSRRVRRASRLIVVVSAREAAAKQAVIFDEQLRAPADDHAEGEHEEQTGGLLHRDDGAHVFAQRQTNRGEAEQDDDEPFRA